MPTSKTRKSSATKHKRKPVYGLPTVYEPAPAIMNALETLAHLPRGISIWRNESDRVVVHVLSLRESPNPAAQGKAFVARGTLKAALQAACSNAAEVYAALASDLRDNGEEIEF